MSGEKASVLFALGVLALWAITRPGCGTDEKGATKVLKQSNYKPLEVGGYDWWNGEDFYKTKFKAISVNGDTVTGAVTKGLCGKGSTIRLND